LIRIPAKFWSVLRGHVVRELFKIRHLIWVVIVMVAVPSVMADLARLKRLMLVLLKLIVSLKRTHGGMRTIRLLMAV